MIDEPLPERDHYARYCSGGTIVNGRVTQAAFYLKDHEFVSVNWLEFLKLPTRDEEINAIRAALAAKGMALRKSGRFAVVNVGECKQEVQRASGQAILITHQPEPPHDPSHSGIFYPGREEALIEFMAARIAECVREELYPAVA